MSALPDRGKWPYDLLDSIGTVGTVPLQTTAKFHAGKLEQRAGVARQFYMLTRTDQQYLDTTKRMQGRLWHTIDPERILTDAST